MPASIAWSTTLRDAATSMFATNPKLLHPSPTTETCSSDFPSFLCFTLDPFPWNDIWDARPSVAESQIAHNKRRTSFCFGIRFGGVPCNVTTQRFLSPSQDEKAPDVGHYGGAAYLPHGILGDTDAFAISLAAVPDCFSAFLTATAGTSAGGNNYD